MNKMKQNGEINFFNNEKNYISRNVIKSFLKNILDIKWKVFFMRVYLRDVCKRVVVTKVFCKYE